MRVDLHYDMQCHVRLKHCVRKRGAKRFVGCKHGFLSRRKESKYGELDSATNGHGSGNSMAAQRVRRGFSRIRFDKPGGSDKHGGRRAAPEIADPLRGATRHDGEWTG